MKRLVLDAASFLDWFAPDGSGRALRAQYEAGSLAILAPRSFPADVLGLLARREPWPTEGLQSIAAEIDLVGFELRDPATTDLATWIANGLRPDRAAYPALASTLGLRLATNDPDLARVAAALVDGA